MHIEINFLTNSQYFRTFALNSANILLINFYSRQTRTSFNETSVEKLIFETVRFPPSNVKDNSK